MDLAGIVYRVSLLPAVTVGLILYLITTAIQEVRGYGGGDDHTPGMEVAEGSAD